MRVSPIAPPVETDRRQANAAPARAPAPAWLLTGRTLAVSAPAAPELRLARMEEWLAELGFRPVVFRSGRRDESRTAGHGGWRHAVLGLLLTPRLALLALREQPRLVLTNTPIQAPALALLKLVLGDRVLCVADVIGLQSMEVEQATPQRWRRSLYGRILRVLEALLVRSADLVLTVNERHGELLRRRSGSPRTRTLRDAADTDLAATPAAERAALGLPDDAVAVAFLGSLVYSRLDPIFAAWRELSRDSEPPLHLVVIGDGPDLKPYARRAADDGLLGRSVSFLGALPHPDAIAAVAACDIAYSECWSEAGFPAKLFEYMALGKPIVVEGKPQLGEVLEDGRDAVFFREPADLAAVLRRLAQDPVLRERLGRGARETFLSAHTAEVRRREFSALLGAPAPKRPSQPAEPAQAPAPARALPSLTTVVIPVLNAAGSVRRQLEAVAAQDYEGAWEVVVVDNGSGDGTAEIARAWADEQHNARLVTAAEVRGAAHARNRGVAAAQGDFIAFCDADDVVTPQWLTELTRAATRADLVGGSRSTRALNSAEVRSWREEQSQLALFVAHGFLRFASGSNFGIWTEVFDQVGGLDELLAAGEDIDLSWRAQLAGFRLGFAPRAVIEAEHRQDLGSLARQQYRYGVSSGQLFRRFRAAGMARPSPAHAAVTWTRLLVTAPALGTSSGRGRWVATAANRWGRVAGSIRYRVAVL
jgi:GT2 family glycosyltransferase/glycosyltransferase involved in cell wall biosynthesis